MNTSFPHKPKHLRGVRMHSSDGGGITTKLFTPEESLRATIRGGNESAKLVMNKGLTLLEVIIAMGIAGLIGGLLVLIIVNSTGISYKQSSKLSEGLAINDTLSRMRTAIKQSNSVAANYTAGSTTYVSGPTQLVLKVPAIDSSNNILPETFDYFVFFLDQEKLRFKSFPDSNSFRQAQDQLFSTNTDTLLFQYLNFANPPAEVVPASAIKLKITMTLKQKSGADYEVITATSEANLRNN